MKTKGNEFFKKKNFRQAMKCFECAVDSLSLDEDEPTRKLKVILKSNMAQCCVNLRLYEDAIEYADEALDYEPKHQKSLFRKCKA
jgi:tetratricopeptide (TPR) repeat protein